MAARYQGTELHKSIQKLGIQLQTPCIQIPKLGHDKDRAWGTQTDRQRSSQNLEMGQTCCCCGCCSSKSEEELGEVPADTTLALVASFSLGDFFFHGQLRRELSFSFSFSMATKRPLYNLQLLLMMMRLPLISKTFSLSLELVLLNLFTTQYQDTQNMSVCCKHNRKTTANCAIYIQLVPSLLACLQSWNLRRCAEVCPDLWSGGGRKEELWHDLWQPSSSFAQRWWWWWSQRDFLNGVGYTREMHWWSWLTFPTAHNGWGFLWLCCSDPPLSPLLNWKKNSLLCQSPSYYDYYCRRSSVPHRPPSGGNVCMRDPSPTRREECRRMLGHYMKSVQSFELELSPSSTNSSSHTSSLPSWLPRSSKKFRIWSCSFQQPSLKKSRAVGWEMVPGLLLFECNSVVELAICQNIQQAHFLLLLRSRRLELLACLLQLQQCQTGEKNRRGRDDDDDDV